jgi:putative tricarboxylic transport membrane protein
VNAFSNFFTGLQTVLSLGNVLYCVFGVLLGVASGVLPGIGPAAMVAMLLPLVFVLVPSSALTLLVCVYVGHLYASTTLATLIDTRESQRPRGASPDGYQLARLGFAGRVFAVSAVASIVGATAATAFTALVGSSIASLALSFGPVEFLAAMVLTLVASLGLGRAPLVPALGMATLGMLLGLVGIDVNTGMIRLTFGITEWLDGIGFIPVAIGMFAVGELIAYSGEKDRRDLVVTRVTGWAPTRDDLGRISAPILRGTTIGSLLGMLPGAGPLFASSTAYTVERAVSSNGDQLGKGAIEGVAAPAASIASATPTSLIPLLSLGIPSSAAMVLIMAALVTFGASPGPLMVQTQAELFWVSIASAWIGSLFVLVLVLPLIGMWLRMLTFPYSWLYPAIIALCAVGAVSANNASLDVVVTAAFGLLGYLFIKLGFETLPFVLGFMLAQPIEQNLIRALLLSKGSPTTFFENPISAVLLAISALLIAGSIVILSRRQRLATD